MTWNDNNDNHDNSDSHDNKGNNDNDDNNSDKGHTVRCKHDATAFKRKFRFILQFISMLMAATVIAVVIRTTSNSQF